MKSNWMGILFSSLLLVESAQAALPPEHETQRLMLAVEQAVMDDRWGDAGEYLNRLQGLDTIKPADYPFYRGLVMQQAGHLNEATAALDEYVTSAGAEGEHYKEALNLITRIEQDRKSSGGGEQGIVEIQPLASIKPAAKNNVAALEKLYLTNSPQDALQQHANSLLELNAWTDGNSKIIRPDAEPDLQYRVTSGTGELQVQETETTDKGRSRVVSEAIPVYGINPLLKWDCPDNGRTCWIYDPRDGSRWLKLGANTDVTAELASTLGDLIRRLQAP